jgi:outer membrane biosynthesis protein TonB
MLKLRFRILPFKADRLGIVACSFSCILHLIFLVLFFFPRKNEQIVQLILTNQRIADMPIHFVSTAHSIPGSLNKISQLQNKNAARTVAKKIAVTGPSTIITSAKTMEKNQSLEKPIAKNQKKLVQKKEEVKKTIKESQKKQAEKKEPELKKIVHQKNEPRKEEQKKEMIVQEKIVASAVNQSESIDSEKPIAIGQQEYDALCLYGVIQEEIVRSWHPPAGIRPARGCIVKVKVDENGKALAATVEESSTIITYDIAARMALLQTYFPREVAGKELIIAFQL